MGGWLSESEVIARVGRLGVTEPRVVVSGNHATPWQLLGLLDAALPRYRLVTLNAQPGVPDREGVVHETCFVGPGVRRSPRLTYIPARLSLIPTMFSSTLAPDVVLLHTTPPRDGVVSLGIEVNVLPAGIDAVRRTGGLVLAQTNEHMPWTGGDALLPVEHLGGLFAVDEPLQPAADRSPTPEAEGIAALVAPLVSDGATLQTGIGAIPDAVLAALASRRGLRVWTEMFSDGVLRLEHAGALDPDSPVVASFLFGSAELLAWCDDNPRVRMLRTEKTNDPALISQQPGMVSVNSALEVDLFGQANASWIDGKVYSGLGGQSDFVVGALHSRGGQAVMALPSWHPRASCSTVVGRLAGPVTSFQHSWIVSEQGRAAVWSQSQRTQTQQIIDHVAHPRVRDELRAAGERLGLIQREGRG